MKKRLFSYPLGIYIMLVSGYGSKSKILTSRKKTGKTRWPFPNSLAIIFFFLSLGSTDPLKDDIQRLLKVICMTFLD